MFVSFLVLKTKGAESPQFSYAGCWFRQLRCTVRVTGSADQVYNSPTLH